MHGRLSPTFRGKSWAKPDAESRRGGPGCAWRGPGHESRGAWASLCAALLLAVLSGRSGDWHSFLGFWVFPVKRLVGNARMFLLAARGVHVGQLPHGHSVPLPLSLRFAHDQATEQWQRVYLPMRHDAKSKKVVIVGGGIAGLCAGVYARRCGCEVEVLEMSEPAGGLATSRRRVITPSKPVHWVLVSSPKGPMYARWKEIFDIGKLRGWCRSRLIWSSALLSAAFATGERLSHGGFGYNAASRSKRTTFYLTSNVVFSRRRGVVVRFEIASAAILRPPEG
jgi:hypothetical protein